MRHRRPREGRVLRERLDRGRHLLDPPAARRRRRHHAVQLPGDGADVDVPDRDRVRQHVRAQAVASAIRRRRSSAPSCCRTPACPPACSTSSTATRSPSIACSSIRRSRRSRFVGSTPIAQYIYETGTKHGKRVQALGGAKNHMIVLPDADMELAADAAVSAGYGSAGERCMAISVVVAVGDAADKLVAAMKERMPKLKVGDGLEPASEMGPLINKAHRDKVAGYVDAGVGEGATLVADGRATARPRATASSSASRCSTTSRRDVRSTRTRSSARCSASCASPPTTRRSS